MYNTSHKIAIPFFSLILLIAGCIAPQFPVIRPVEDSTPQQDSKSRAEEYFIRARDFDRRGMAQSAERYYELAYQLDPDSRVLREQVVRKYIGAGKFAQALLLVKNNKNNSELDRDSKRLVSTIYLQMGELAKSAEILQSIADKSDDELYSLGLICERIGKNSEAVDAYLGFYNRNPEEISVGLRVGRLLLNEKQFARAESLYTEIQKITPDNPEVLTAAGNLELITTDTANALSYFNRALKLDSLYEEALRSTAQVYISKNRFADAIKIYQQLYSAGSVADVYGRTLALLYYYNKQYEDAEKLFFTLLQSSGNDPELHYYLGLVFTATERADLGKLQFEKTIALNNTMEDAWRELCYISIRQKDYEEALSVAERFIAATPSSSGGWRLTGYIYNIQKKFEKAIQNFKHATVLDSTDYGSWFELGSAFERNKQIDSAAVAFRNVLRLHPEDPAASNYLGYMWAEKGINLDTAMILLQNALKKEPDNGAFLDSYAWIFFQKGDLDSAYFYILKAAEKITDDPIVFSHLGDIYYKKGELKSALDAYKKSLEFKPEEIETVKLKISTIEGLLRQSGYKK